MGLPACLVPALGFVDPPYGVAPRRVEAEAALVLSGDVDYLRLRRAAELYRMGAVGAVLLTGSGIGGDSGPAMREVAQRELGVSAEAIIVEDRSESTRENILLATPLIGARGWRQVALVTSSSHMGRALRAARRAVPDVQWIPVPVEDAGPPRRIYRTRLAEWAKLLYYATRGWV